MMYAQAANNEVLILVLMEYALRCDKVLIESITGQES